MPLRIFENSRGESCKVWNVTPFANQGTDRRNADRRVVAAAGYTGPERRCGRDRRVRTPGLMTPGLESGWLCFERGEEKRRLTPIPQGWDDAPDAELELLFESARPVTRRPMAIP
jgi:hypothetical protein